MKRNADIGLFTEPSRNLDDLLDVEDVDDDMPFEADE
jgi:hypothetical protein